MNKKFKVKYSYEDLCKETVTYPVISGNYIFYGLGLLVIGIISKLFFSKDNNGNILSIAIIVLSIIIILLAIYCMPAVREKLYMNRSKKCNEVFKNGLEYDYDFNESGFTVNSIVNGQIKTKTMQYKDIKIFSIGKNSLYFINDGKKMYMCPKNEFSDEEVNKLIQIFKENKVKVIK